jgi:photosystem II stability/assembly factor-like uncharacterized protein
MPVIAGDKVTLWKATARWKDLVYVAVTLDHLVADGVSDSTFLSNDQGQWYGAGEADWSTAAICFVTIPSERMVAVSEDGEVHTYVSGTSTQEIITPPPRVLRALSTIGGRAYACGMLREVYVRTGEAQWQAISAPEASPGVPAGFEAIAGLGEENIYAVGWRGEIWQRKDDGWIQRDSPANVILTGVCCTDDGYAYICGQNGTLIKGRDDQWAIIDHELPTQDYWDIHAFGGLFVGPRADQKRHSGSCRLRRRRTQYLPPSDIC